MLHTKPLSDKISKKMAHTSERTQQILNEYFLVKAKVFQYIAELRKRRESADASHRERLFAEIELIERKMYEAHPSNMIGKLKKIKETKQHKRFSQNVVFK